MPRSQQPNNGKSDLESNKLVEMSTPINAEDFSKVFDSYHDADIILQTTDGFEIPTHKWPLCRVSEVFRTMLKLPQPAKSDKEASLNKPFCSTTRMRSTSSQSTEGHLSRH
jgi:hypothetical protein